MAFTMDGVIIDRIQMAIAEDFSGNILYTLSQLADATIEITAESKDATDAQGTLIKRFYTGKQGTFTANNAIIDFNILAASAGSAKETASTGSAIKMPGVKTVPVGTTTTTLTDVVEGSVRVIGVAANGTMTKTYTKDTTADTDKFSITSEELTLPTDSTVSKFVIKYDRNVESGIRIVNRADEFPKTIKLTLKVLAVDPCSTDTVRSALIVLPSFQVSPETSLSLTTDTQLEYTGDLQVSYCGDDKTLYEIYFAEDDVEE